MEIPTEEYTVPIGKANKVREGLDITLVSHGRMVHMCEDAAKQIEKEGISCEVIDLRTIKPVDLNTVVESIKKTHFCVLVEEGHAFGGIASEIGFQIQEAIFDYLDAPLARVCQRETPMPYSIVLENESLPNVDRIISAIHSTLSR